MIAEISKCRAQSGRVADPTELIAADPTELIAADNPEPSAAPAGIAIEQRTATRIQCVRCGTDILDW